MSASGRRHRAATVLLAVVSLSIAPGGALAPWIPVALAAAVTAAPDPDAPWPRRYQTADGGIVVIYQPQIASWEHQKRMTLYAAVAHTPKGGATSLLGTIQAEADTRVSVADRVV